MCDCHSRMLSCEQGEQGPGCARSVCKQASEQAGTVQRAHQDTHEARDRLRKEHRDTASVVDIVGAHRAQSRDAGLKQPARHACFSARSHLSAKPRCLFRSKSKSHACLSKCAVVSKGRREAPDFERIAPGPASFVLLQQRHWCYDDGRGDARPHFFLRRLTEESQSAYATSYTSMQDALAAACLSSLICSSSLFPFPCFCCLLDRMASSPVRLESALPEDRKVTPKETLITTITACAHYSILSVQRIHQSDASSGRVRAAPCCGAGARGADLGCRSLDSGPPATPGICRLRSPLRQLPASIRTCVVDVYAVLRGSG
jgi:hypothetical protein